MSKIKGSKDKKLNGAVILAFFKKNVYYFIIGICIIALAAVITVAAVINSKETIEPNGVTSVTPNGGIEGNTDNGDDVVNGGDTVLPPDVIVDNLIQDVGFFISAPVDSYTIGDEFSNTTLVWNATQKHWATHEGVDFMASAGTEVKAAYEGVVSNVSTDSYYGTTITISHKDGYETIYKLLQDVVVSTGDSVSKGQVLGKISADALAEIAQGAHLHFELCKDGERINPMDYLLEGDK